MPRAIGLPRGNRLPVARFALAACLALASVSCDGRGINDNPVFSGTTFVESSVSTGDDGKPLFLWISPGTSWEILGVFSAPITVANGSVSNKADCVAMWYTSMAGTAGAVEWNQLKAYSAGAVTQSAPTLPSGALYYWAVWCVDSGGTVTASTAQNTVRAP